MKTIDDKLQLFNEVQTECERFMKRINDAKKRIHDDKRDGYERYSCKENAALKRAALDLKNELSRITKMGVYVF